MASSQEAEAFLRRLLEASDTLEHPCIVHDHEFRIQFANQAYLNAAQARLDEVAGKPYWEVYPRVPGPFPFPTEGGAPETCQTTESGEIYCMRSLALRDLEGPSLYGVQFIEDVTERRRLEAALQREQALTHATIESAPGIFYVIDPDCRFIRWNQYLNRMTGLSDEELRQTHALSIVHPDDKERVNAKIREIFSVGYGEAETRLLAKDKGVREYTFTGKRFSTDGAVYLAGIATDITEYKRAEYRLEHLATHDRLTDLPNRNLFFDRLQHGLDRAARHGAQLAVLFVDLDNFKQINDSLGHATGDVLLSQAADRLRACTRRQDTVSRLGGDEFTVIVEDFQEGAEATVAATAERIIEALSARFDLGVGQVQVTASVGIALYPKDGRDMTTLLRHADVAMYKAKELGKNNYQFFAEDMNAQTTERRALENELREALARDEFFLVYQPQVNLRSARVIGVEALLRWQHPRRGLVLPEEFIPLAESSGLIIPIGEWVLRGVCAQLRAWSGSGLRSVRVAINLSPRQFRQEGLAENIRNILSEYDISPASLGIELTETCVMDDAASATTILRQLKAMGIGLALDDFGVGYSSLQYLKRFPIDDLKIDSHFIKDLATDPEDQAIVTAIITMGHSMHMEVIAEGVETHQQLEFLRGRGCDSVQGHFVNYPLSAQRTGEVLGLA
ncbi:MAG: EAL domain-containing protein [Gammaproteobacteria bacterium]